MGIYDRMAQNISDEDFSEIMDGLQESDIDINSYLKTLVDEQVAPELVDVRDRAGQEDHRAIREALSELSDDEQDEYFYDAVADVVAALALVRERPEDGLRELKPLLRDPYTIESLLLIFDNETHVDPEFAAQQKEFAAKHLRWIGATVLPEMYEDDELNEVRKRFDFGGDVDLSHLSDGEAKP